MQVINESAVRSRQIRRAILPLLLGGSLVLGLSTQASADQQASDIAKVTAEAPQHVMDAGQAPDGRGDGPYPAVKRKIDGPTDLVAYYPADLQALGQRKLPIYVFGNGACSEDGASARQHLLEIASHGYLAIAPGGIFSGPGVTMTKESFEQHRDKTRAVQLGQAVNWAIAENGRAGSPFYGRLDTRHIALSGYSCGGIQALKYAGDSRISTFVIMNSGILDSAAPQSGEMAANKQILGQLSVPVLYVLGGPRDIAYPNGMDDFKRIKGVPAVVINTDVTHAGTYDEPNGGRAAKAVVAWLDWQLRGDETAKASFVGQNCRLCSDPAWTIERKGF